MMEEMLRIGVIVAHLLAVKVASSFTPLGIASGVALTNPEPMGGVVVELVKNNVKALYTGVTGKKDKTLNKDESERLVNTSIP